MRLDNQKFENYLGLYCYHYSLQIDLNKFRINILRIMVVEEQSVFPIVEYVYLRSETLY